MGIDGVVYHGKLLDELSRLPAYMGASGISRIREAKVSRNHLNGA